MKIKNKKGVTVIELVAIMTVIGILVLLAIPLFLGYTEEARITHIKNDTKIVENGVETYEVQNKGDTLSGEMYDKIELENKISENKVYTIRGLFTSSLFGNSFFKLDDDFVKTVSNTRLKGEFVLNESTGGVFYIDTRSGVAVSENDETTNGGEDETTDETTGDNNNEDNLIINGDSLLTDEEITTLVTQGWIPVATPIELSNISENTSFIFGENTIWEGTYESGLNKKYIQVADLDFIGVSNFEPIGEDLYVTFRGSYDGNGYVIKNVNIEHPSRNNVGLFGTVNTTGVIRNLALENIKVEGNYNVGGIIGRMSSGEISNSYATGYVIGNGYVGGIVGYGSGMFSNLFTITYLQGNEYLGGVAGRLSGDLKDSYAKGTVVGTKFVGGLIGLNNSHIIDSFADIDVGGKDNVGGLVGSNASSVSFSFARGSVDGETKVGGITGNNSGYIDNSYSTNTINGLLEVGGIAGYGGNITNSHSKSKVTGVESVGGIVGLIKTSSMTFINNYFEGEVFGETYVGGIVGETEKYNLQGGIILNSYSNGVVRGVNYVGGIVGLLDDYYSVKNSYSTSDITGTGSHTGGIIGSSRRVTVRDNYFSGNITGNNYTGGIVGSNNGKIYYNLMIGQISGNDYVGGITGYNNEEISYSYSLDNVIGVGDNIGGLVGYNNDKIQFSDVKTLEELKHSSLYSSWDIDIWDITNGEIPTLKPYQ